MAPVEKVIKTISTLTDTRCYSWWFFSSWYVCDSERINGLGPYLKSDQSNCCTQRVFYFHEFTDLYRNAQLSSFSFFNYALSLCCWLILSFEIVTYFWVSALYTTCLGMSHMLRFWRRIKKRDFFTMCSVLLEDFGQRLQQPPPPSRASHASVLSYW